MANMRGSAVFELDPKTRTQTRVLSQTGPAPGDGKGRLIFIAAGAFPANAERSFLLYFGQSSIPPADEEGAVSCTDAEGGGKWLENDKVRLLIGPEGAHIYRWEVKALGDLDLTQPGERDWAGFADVRSPHRNARNVLQVVASGPVCARIRCTDDAGLEKVISLFAGAAWTEVMLNSGSTWFWNYDNPPNFAADGPTPGTALFSNGHTAPVRRPADSFGSQVKAANVTWSAKHRPDGLLLGLITPETKARHVVGPGGGMGGTGIENSPPALHFLTYGGVAQGSPADVLNTLEQTMTLRDQPEVTMYSTETRRQE
jgi:hypothetical protein